nr:uncharacterized protein LOC113690635 [Coffea arabica]
MAAEDSGGAGRAAMAKLGKSLRRSGTSFIRQLAVGNASQAKVCGICTGMGHSTEMCPLIQGESVEQVNMTGHAPAPRQPYDPYSNTYNPGWRDHSNFSYGGNRQSNFALNRQQGYQQQLEKSKKQDNEKEILEVLHKVEINIPLLDAIKQVPKYAKFLRDLCVNQRRLGGDERVIVGENVSAVLQRKLLPKCGDPDMFTIPCTIGNTLIRKAMLNLGASINIMPKSIYTSLNLGPLKEIGLIIQLADRTNAYPDELVDDVLVKINDLVFSTDFYVLDVDDDHSPDPSPLLLGRPFFSTAQTKLDVNKGTLSIEFDEKIVNFNIFDTMEHPVNSHSVFAIHAINPFVQEFSEFACRDKFKIVANKY